MSRLRRVVCRHCNRETSFEGYVPDICGYCRKELFPAPPKQHIGPFSSLAMREVVASLMESGFYFGMNLVERKNLAKRVFFRQFG